MPGGDKGGIIITMLLGVVGGLVGVGNQRPGQSCPSTVEEIDNLAGIGDRPSRDNSQVSVLGQ
jgi:hypothetical protein